MAILKCKMCGGSLNVTDENAVCECEFCGTQQTVPKSSNDENVAELFNRANDFRASFNFDKAERLYEQIIESSPDEAEAYWGLILCKFGIEYVKDPRTMNRVPTCHRSSYDPIVTDINYKNALKYANVVQKPIYEKEAKQIDEIQKGILTLARDEEPYDIFLCYKETDASGKRTPDSVLANDIYHQMTNQGYKVFYAAITLEDKLGSAYEPYIFAALNSAKIMLVIGTRPEYFKAVWVKNEWSRYLQIIKKDMKKVLVPCYRDMDAYELPEEFAHLQALDMTKIGFINDIERACEKVCGKRQESAPAPTTVNNTQGANPGVANLVRRMYNFIDDGDNEEANNYAEKILDIDSDCGEAYIGKLLIEYKLKDKEDLKTVKIDTNSRNYRSLMRTTDEGAKSFVKSAMDARCEKIYKSAEAFLENGQLQKAIDAFKSISDYKDSNERARIAKKELDDIKNAKELERKQGIYDEAVALINEAKAKLNPATYGLKDREATSALLKKANELFLKIPGFLDVPNYSRVAKELQNEWVYLTCKKLFAIESYEQVITLSKHIKGYKDIDQVALECEEKLLDIQQEKDYGVAVDFFNSGKYAPALNKFKLLENYKDSAGYIKQCEYNIALGLYNSENFSAALEKFEELFDYQDSSNYIELCRKELRDREEAYERYLKKYPLIRRKKEIESAAEPVLKEIEQKEKAASSSGCLTGFFIWAAVIIGGAGITMASLDEDLAGGGIFALIFAAILLVVGFRPVYVMNKLKSQLKEYNQLQEIPPYRYEDWKDK